MSEPLLAGRLELTLLRHGPRSASRLAELVGARKASVLEELHRDPRFERIGRGAASKWSLRTGTDRSSWEPMGTDREGEAREDTGLEHVARLEACERRLEELERHLAAAAPRFSNEPPRFRGEIIAERDGRL